MITFYRAACTAVAAFILLTAAAFADWKASPFDGEDSKAAIGCDAMDDDDSWLCLVVRCDAPGHLSLYVELTDLDVRDELFLEVDGVAYPVTGVDPGAAPYRSRLTGDTRAIVAALKGGRKLFVNRPQYPFNPGFDTISLRKSGSAIGAVEQSCGVQAAEAPAPPIGGSSLPLKLGIYVRAEVACQGADNASTMSYWGEELNAQRVIGKILSVTADGNSYAVQVSAHDIAEGVDIGEFDWVLTIPRDTEFTLASSSPEQTYRWCAGLPGRPAAAVPAAQTAPIDLAHRFDGYVRPGREPAA